MIYGISNQKGGCCKTTLSLNIAATLAADGARVLVVDADPQGSAQAWAQTRQREPLFSVVGIPRANLHKEVAALAGAYDHILIDGPSRVADITRAIIMAADVIVIPVQPSPFDLWSSAELVKLIQEASVFKETLKSAFAITRKIANTAIGRDFEEAVLPYGISVLSPAITQRVIWPEAAAQGLAIFEADRHSPAVRELQDLTTALLDLSTQP